jgi:hypothetical protein
MPSVANSYEYCVSGGFPGIGSRPRRSLRDRLIERLPVDLAHRKFPIWSKFSKGWEEFFP